MALSVLTSQVSVRADMTSYRRLQVSKVGNIAVVRFSDRKILDDANILQIGQDLRQIAEEQGANPMLINFSEVEFLSSAALGKLIVLDKQIKSLGGKLKLSNIRPEIFEVFAITRLNRVFDIHEDESDALAALGAG